MTLSELIAKLEAATEGSWELDELIAGTIAGATLERQPEGRPAWYQGRSWPPGGQIHPWTTSLDAALTMVPPGWFIARLAECVMPVIYRGDQASPTGLWQAAINNRDGAGNEKAANAKSIALALVIAALRAREK